jgi:polysaccharide export outer membrane protein
MRGFYGYVTLAVAALVLLFARSAGALEPDYVLGPDDSISVVVLRHPELQASGVIPPDGKIVVPILGEVLAAGKTRAQLTKEIVARLRGRIEDPEVSVMLQSQRQRPIYVIGLISAPGVVNLRSGWRVSEAIAAAHGLTERPELTRATLFKPDGRAVSLNMEEIMQTPERPGNVTLETGDVLNIQQLMRGLAYAVGSVGSPGVVQDLREGWRVIELLAASGGLTIAPQYAAARLLRQNGKVVNLDLVKILAAPDSAENVAIEPGDVLSVLPAAVIGTYVVGRVVRPGFYQLGPGAGIAQAIRAAGGPQAGVELTKVQVYHADGTQETVDVQRAYVGDDPSLDKPLRGGDAVLVP